MMLSAVMANGFLSDLSGEDLGKVLTVRDGGSTHTGALVSVQHSQYGRDASCLIHLKADDWKFVKHLPPETPYEERDRGVVRWHTEETPDDPQPGDEWMRPGEGLLIYRQQHGPGTAGAWLP